MTLAWPEVQLSEIARPVLRPVAVLPGTQFRTIGVKWWGEGAYERQTIDGSQTAARTLSLVRDGDLIINKIWVRHGSTAIASESVDGCAASGEFPTFELNPKLVLPQWLHWHTKTRGFWARCDALSRGSSGKNRIKPDQFLTIRVPLPSIDQQRRIVEQIEEIAGRVEEARRLRGEAEAETEALASSAASAVFRRLKNGVPLGDVCEVIDPNPSHRYPMYVPDGVPIVSSSEFVGEDAIDGSRTKRVPRSFFDDTLGRFDIQPGDVVFSRKGKVGYARPYPADQILAMTHTLCVLKPDRAKLNPQFLLHFSRSSVFIGALLSTMNPNVGVPTLGLGVIRGIAIPIPRLEVQQRIANELQAVRALSSAVRSDCKDSRLSLDSLLPAVLDKAFRGEM